MNRQKRGGGRNRGRGGGPNQPRNEANISRKGAGDLDDDYLDLLNGDLMSEEDESEDDEWVMESEDEDIGQGTIHKPRGQKWTNI